ncbi:MAG: hypothetical protein F6K24_53510 [Okeania sp. SIO2D1]|nr:hypothetical protein [Okeania sp. SIO2D1]
MIAGALVNERDISKGVFTPDVTFPQRQLSPDEFIFFSTLPQALSTEAEMMTRYTGETLNGKDACLQRIHVTGGTNGILVSSLREHRPFTPSFIGRAEDQAYILSTFVNGNTQLGYAHESGLIMRHDKEAFAQEAIKMAKVGKAIGDFIRILIFSNYVKVLGKSFSDIKEVTNPFTGCFISQIPTTVVYLRFCLKVASLFAEGKSGQALEFIKNGVPRLQETLDFVQGENSQLKQAYEKEKQGWNLYYDILAQIEEAIASEDDLALKLQQEAQAIIDQCAIN